METAQHLHNHALNAVILVYSSGIRADALNDCRRAIHKITFAKRRERLLGDHLELLLGRRRSVRSPQIFVRAVQLVAYIVQGYTFVAIALSSIGH